MDEQNDPKQQNAEPSIDIRTPGLVEAFESVGAMQTWELLRRNGTPLTAAELARISRMPERTVLRALDRFEAVSLVRRHPAARRIPSFDGASRDRRSRFTTGNSIPLTKRCSRKW